MDEGLALNAYIEHLEGRLAQCWRDALEVCGREQEPRGELFATLLLLEEARKERVLAQRRAANIAA